MNWLAIVATAALSAALTCSVIAWWLQNRVRPRFMAQLDEEFRQRLKEASDVMALRVEEAVSRGVREGVTSLASREVIQGTTRNIARTGAGFVEDSLGKILGRRPPRGGDQE
ncbi:MAG: hypothetical protein P1U78_06390 [Alcanivoracaceae bacterium]|nr:hypothetical protein [Alcanivoracaceae bacterium]